MAGKTQKMTNDTHNENGNGPHRLGSPRSLGLDLIQLGELQLELLRTDLASATKAVRIAACLAVVAIALLIAAAPVLLLALAAVVESVWQLSHAASLAIAGGVAVGASLLLGLAGWTIGKSGMVTFSRSSDEFRSNVDWLKQVLATPRSDGADEASIHS